MTLGEATSLFLAHSKQRRSTADPQSKSEIDKKSLVLLTSYYANNIELSEITHKNLRDFLGRWYVENSLCSTPNHATSIEPDKHPTTNQGLPAPPNTYMPEPLDLLNSIGELVGWIDRQTGSAQAAHLSPILNELRTSLPRALAITNALSKASSDRGGAFSFPEFLTSFEGGGSSRYDIDVPGNVGAMDGYFRIMRVEGSLIEADELISEERVWPIVIPAEVAPLLDVGYILNLELVRKEEGWHIAACGFAYPPETQIG